MRVSEVINLKLNDIDSDRMQVRIERSKGKKDRYVMLSPLLLDVLRAYLKLYRPMPEAYLFEGLHGEQYSTRSAQEIFQHACRKAGIHKQLTFHSLRHSFATHFALKRVLTLNISKICWVNYDIKITERYLYVAREKLVVISKPVGLHFKKEKVIKKLGYAQPPKNYPKN